MALKDIYYKFREARKALKTFKEVSELSHDGVTFAGMKITKFVTSFARKPGKILRKMSDDELEMLFSHPDIIKIFSAMPRIKTAYEYELNIRIEEIEKQKCQKEGKQ